MVRLTQQWLHSRKERKVERLAVALLMLSGGIPADPMLLQRIARKATDPHEIDDALQRARGTPLRHQRV